MLETGFGLELGDGVLVMQNELRYQVRSREIVDLVSALRSSRLTLSPYFQRNLVWRDAHKKDFIDTILKGYPFPQIFLARGPINLDTMEASQCVVDGQQRLNTIREFVSGKLSSHEGSYFSELSAKQKEEFLKYEVAVIDFDLDAGDFRLKEIFHRLNRTYYSLSAIEKISSEYSASDFLLVARVLSGEISNKEVDVNDDLFEELPTEEVPENRFSRDPGIDDALGDAPADGGQPLRRADADDATRYGMRCRDRYAEPGRGEQGDRTAGFGAESLHRRQTGDLRSHRFHNPPAPDQRAKSHHRLAGKHHPERHMEVAAKMALRIEQHRNNAHGLLGVVATVTE